MKLTADLIAWLLHVLQCVKMRVLDVVQHALTLVDSNAVHALLSVQLDVELHVILIVQKIVQIHVVRIVYILVQKNVVDVQIYAIHA